MQKINTIVENIINKKLHELARAFLDLLTFIQFSIHINAAYCYFQILKTLNKITNYLQLAQSEPELREAAELRCITKKSGEQCVMIHGTLTTLTLCVECWDFLKHFKLTITPNMVKERGKYGSIMQDALETKTVYLSALIPHGELIIVAIQKMLGWFAPIKVLVIDFSNYKINNKIKLPFTNQLHVSFSLEQHLFQ